ncbi:hypothetical protein EVAR_50987_1 [Eumeta japonica]|uniref:Uncharacterized protein n=1 Tax=Eumeta variegata TaxID=151549 RepID=A0A4C1XBN9_EUMVA|nr:hypothetical protein EVAR_50987_1 [Eumeta japonica]
MRSRPPRLIKSCGPEKKKNCKFPFLVDKPFYISEFAHILHQLASTAAPSQTACPKTFDGDKNQRYLLSAKRRTSDRAYKRDS